jgi:drug/metabolite transporter (DMT)-like permease
LPPPRSAYIAWIAVCVLWGTTYLAIRVALDSMPPLLMAGVRWTLAGALFVLVLGLRGARLPASSEWPAQTLLGLLLVGLGNGGVVWAEQTLPTGLTAVLVAVIPFWMVGIEHVAGGSETLSLRQWSGLLMGFAGIVVLVWPELNLGSGSGDAGGVVATQLACAGWALGSSVSRRRRTDEDVLASAAIQMLFGGLCLVAVGTLRGEWASFGFTPRSAWAMVYLMFAGSIAGYSAYGHALKHLPVSTVSLYAYINPVIAVLLGTFVLGEALSPRLAIAGAAVLAGMALVRRR